MDITYHDSTGRLTHGGSTSILKVLIKNTGIFSKDLKPIRDD